MVQPGLLSFGGFLHGFYLIVERLLKGKINLKINRYNGLILAFLTFTCVNITWVFFRAESFSTAWNLLLSMFYVHGQKAIITSNHLITTLSLMTLVFFGQYVMRTRSLVSVIEAAPRLLLIILWGLMIFGLMIVQTEGQQFIYFQF